MDLIFFAGEIVMLRDIKSMNQNIFLTVDTTCPLPRSDRPPTPKTPPRSFEPPPTIHEVRPISVSGLYLGIKYAIVVVDIVSSNYLLITCSWHQKTKPRIHQFPNSQI